MRVAHAQYPISREKPSLPKMHPTVHDCTKKCFNGYFLQGKKSPAKGTGFSGIPVIRVLSNGVVPVLLGDVCEGVQNSQNRCRVRVITPDVPQVCSDTAGCLLAVTDATSDTVTGPAATRPRMDRPNIARWGNRHADGVHVV